MTRVTGLPGKVWAETAAAKKLATAHKEIRWKFFNMIRS
jgi:hypothetical protein